MAPSPTANFGQFRPRDLNLTGLPPSFVWIPWPRLRFPENASHPVHLLQWSQGKTVWYPQISGHCKCHLRKYRPNDLYSDGSHANLGIPVTRPASSVKLWQPTIQKPGPSRILSASLISPLLTPFRYNSGIAETGFLHQIELMQGGNHDRIIPLAWFSQATPQRNTPL